MSEDNHSTYREVERLIVLLKKGDALSLIELRCNLGITHNSLASSLDLSVSQIKRWENGEEQPSVIHRARWKLALSKGVDTKISKLLSTSNNEIITQFLELLWTINE